MTVTIHGIGNCDTMKKAFAWLNEHAIAFDFRDYKKRPPAREELAAWCESAGWEKVVNRAGMTFRKLPDEAKSALNAAKAIALMLEKPSMIRRPVLETGATIEVGFKPDRYAMIFAK